ncbi:10106_t:CDS:2, partial [Ambispora leptoticha]
TLNGTSFRWDKDFFDPDYKFSRTINQTIHVASVLNWDGYGKDTISLDDLNSGLNNLSFNDVSSGEREDHINTQFYSDSSSDDYGVDDVDCCYSDYDDYYFDD